MSGVAEEEEQRLRERLDACLTEIAPGPIPLDAVLSAGRRIRRKRAWTSGGLAATSAAAVAGCLLVVLPAHTPPASADNARHTHSVQVNSAAHDQALALIGSGTVDGIPWQVAMDPASGGTLMESVGGGPSSPSGLVNGMPTGTNGPLESLIISGESPYQNTDEGFYVGNGLVPSDVGKLVFDYPNGESVTVPVVSWHGKDLVAFAGTPSLPVSRVTVYDRTGRETGYSIPFNGLTQPVISSWYTPRQVPTEPTGAKTVSGTTSGIHWSITTDTGPFGICIIRQLPTGSGETSGCRQSVVPAANTIADVLQYAGGSTLPPILAGAVNPEVARVEVALTNGATVQLPVWSVGAVKMVAAVLPLGTRVETVTSYDRAGGILARQQQ